MTQPAQVPTRAWVVTAAGTAVNLCLGILYAWSVWKAELVRQDKSTRRLADDRAERGLDVPRPTPRRPGPTPSAGSPSPCS